MTGGDPQQLERLCDWDMQIEDGQVGTYLVRTRGARHGRSAKLLVMTKLADARNAENLGSYSRMNRLRPLDRMVPENHGVRPFRSTKGWKKITQMNRLQRCFKCRFLSLRHPRSKPL
jgi:hypothetical protein